MTRKFPPTHSFGITTCGEMRAKLERELERVGRSTIDPDPQVVVDHTINCALTAWHMVDWVWQLHFRDNTSAQQQLATKAQVNIALEKRTGAPTWFHDALFKYCGSDNLQLCEAIAIGSKHVYPERASRPVEAIDSDVTARPTQVFTLDFSTLGGGDVLAADDGSALASTQYLPKITRADGTKQFAIQVLDGVTVFWQQFLSDFGIP